MGFDISKKLLPVKDISITCAINTYHHLRCELKSRSWWGILEVTLCDKVCQWLATGQWFSLGTPVSSTIKTDCDDITEILLKMALNTITLIPLFIRLYLKRSILSRNDSNYT